MTVFYHADYLAAAHAFATTRKAGWVWADLRLRPIAGLEWREPDSATFAQLTAAHEPAYVTAVQTGTPATLASGSGFPWDPGIGTATRRSTGGVVAAALEAWRGRHNVGSLFSGLHHARRAHGAGFCTFNGLAVAALAVLAAGARRVLIVDLDAHGGRRRRACPWLSCSREDIRATITRRSPSWPYTDKPSRPPARRKTTLEVSHFAAFAAC
jgi:acetoin utilization deacetylase AcuC-like enzyme